MRYVKEKCSRVHIIIYKDKSIKIKENVGLSLCVCFHKNSNSSIINDSLIWKNRVPSSDSDASFRQQNVTFQCKMTLIIRPHENVAKYFH